MSWIDQGRQEHGWFGDGTASIADKTTAAGGKEPPAANGLDQRITAVIHGSIAAMPRGARPRAERLAAGGWRLAAGGRTAYGTGGHPAVKAVLGIIKARLLATGTYP